VNRFGNVFSINTTIYVVLRRVCHCWGQQTNICRLIWNVFFIIQDKRAPAIASNLNINCRTFSQKPKADSLILDREMSGDWALENGGNTRWVIPETLMRPRRLTHRRCRRRWSPFETSDSYRFLRTGGRGKCKSQQQYINGKVLLLWFIKTSSALPPLDSYLYLLLSQATPDNKPNSNMKHER